MSEVVDVAVADAREAYAARETELGADILRQVERSVMLSIIDNKWREHLADMDYLRAGIGLRAMGQRDPLVEYQREAYDMFAEMIDAVRRDVGPLPFPRPARRAPEPARHARATVAAVASGSALGGPVHAEDKGGTQRPCPCGSGQEVQAVPRSGCIEPLVERYPGDREP